jgi:hypothetical protein
MLLIRHVARLLVDTLRFSVGERSVVLPLVVLAGLLLAAFVLVETVGLVVIYPFL